LIAKPETYAKQLTFLTPILKLICFCSKKAMRFGKNCSVKLHFDTPLYSHSSTSCHRTSALGEFFKFRGFCKFIFKQFETQ